MARFYASMNGNRGEASRMGTPSSGIYSHTRGWNAGIRVEANAYGPDRDEDVIHAVGTHGSNGYGANFNLARIVTTPRGLKVTIYNPKNGKSRGTYFLPK